MKRVQIIFLMSSFVLFPAVSIFAQAGAEDSVEENAESQNPQGSSEDIVTIEEPAYEYFYWPDEDLNSFGLSSMGSGKSGTTMGNESERTSNLEVNPPRKRSTDVQSPDYGETVGDVPILPREEYSDAPGAVIEPPPKTPFTNGSTMTGICT